MGYQLICILLLMAGNVIGLAMLNAGIHTAMATDFTSLVLGLDVYALIYLVEEAVVIPTATLVIEYAATNLPKPTGRIGVMMEGKLIAVS